MATWTPLASLPVTIYNAGAAWDGADTIYIAAGVQAGSNSANLYAYSIANNTYTPKAAAGATNAVASAAFVAGSGLYVGGPWNSFPQQVRTYSPTSGNWGNTLSRTNSIRSTMLATLSSNLVFAPCGDGSSVPTAQVDQWIISSSNWQGRAPLSTPLDSAGIAFDGNDTVYLVGGYDGTAASDVLHAYSVAGNSWSTKASLPYAIENPTAVCGPDGKLYVLGGFAGSFPDDSVHIYDPVADSWGDGTSYPDAIYKAASCIGPDGVWYVFGGFGNSGAVTDAYSFNLGQQNESAGSTATLTVTTAGGGQAAETAAGGASSTVTAASTAGGTATETASAGASSTVTVTSTGGGLGPADYEGGSVAAVTITAAGGGQAAEAVEAGSGAAVTITAVGGGTISTGISGGVADFPDWVPPHIVVATDNVIYDSPAAGDPVPFSPEFVGLGPWASIVLTVQATATDTGTVHQTVLSWLIGPTIVHQQTVDAVALVAGATGLAGFQLSGPAHAESLRVEVLGVDGLESVHLTLAGTTRQLPESITPATFPGPGILPVPPQSISLAAGASTLFAIGPYAAGSRFVVWPPDGAEITAERSPGTVTDRTTVLVQSWAATDNTAPPAEAPAPAGVLLWVVKNTDSAAATFNLYGEGMPT